MNTSRTMNPNKSMPSKIGTIKIEINKRTKHGAATKKKAEEKQKKIAEHEG